MPWRRSKMEKTKFIGVRMEKEIYDIIDNVTRQEKLDKTAAIKKLIREGYKEMRLQRAIEQYAKGLVSVDKAAELAGLPMTEMMRTIAFHGIKSEETVEEYKEGMKFLLHGWNKAP